MVSCCTPCRLLLASPYIFAVPFVAKRREGRKGGRKGRRRTSTTTAFADSYYANGGREGEIGDVTVTGRNESKRTSLERERERETDRQTEIASNAS